VQQQLHPQAKEANMKSKTKKAERTAPALRKYRVTIGQRLLTTFVIEAEDENAAHEIACEMYETTPGAGSSNPPERWEIDYGSYEIDDCDCLTNEMPVSTREDAEVRS
jgi:hypothetical protein